jgi:hypothetical protein
MKPFFIIALFLLVGAAAELRADDEVRMKDGTTRK